MRYSRRCAALLAVSLAACSGGSTGGFSPAPGASALMRATHVWVFSPTNVWILDGSATVHRFDGAAWSTLATPSTGGLGCIFALSETQTWLCAGTQVLAYDGTNFTATDVTTPTGLHDLNSLWASSPSDIWATGSDAIVAHFDGTTWSGMVAGEPNKSSVWGSGPSDVYALSVFDLSHFDGHSWSMANPDGEAGDGQVWGTSASDVWVMPGSSTVSHFDGTAWKSMDLDLVGELSAAWGPAPNDVWAVGTAGAIAHWDGGSWNEVGHQAIGAPYLQQLVDVKGSSSSNIWIVGNQLGSGGSSSLIYRR